MRGGMRGHRGGETEPAINDAPNDRRREVQSKLPESEKRGERRTRGYEWKVKEHVQRRTQHDGGGNGRSRGSGLGAKPRYKNEQQRQSKQPPDHFILACGYDEIGKAGRERRRRYFPQRRRQARPEQQRVQSDIPGSDNDPDSDRRRDRGEADFLSLVARPYEEAGETEQKYDRRSGKARLEYSRHTRGNNENETFPSEHLSVQCLLQQIWRPVLSATGPSGRRPPLSAKF